jgi:hypothetical protein
VAHICPEFDGYIHIRSAIQARKAAADDLETNAGETGRDSIGAVDSIHEALAGLHKRLTNRSSIGTNSLLISTRRTSCKAP